MPSHRRSLAAVHLAALCAVACADLGRYVWIDDMPELASPESEYRLAPGDTINLRVFNQEGVSGRLKLRPDGRITVPFLNDVPAAGKTAQELAGTLQSKLREFINTPVVTVSLEEAVTPEVSVLGEVARPGVYAVERGQGVLRALAAAGGLTNFAHKDRIFVVRSGSEMRVRMTFDGLATPGSRGSKFRLQQGDVVVVQ